MTTGYEHWQFGGGAASPYESGCTHNGVKHVLTIGKCRVFAGSRSEAEKEGGWKLIISLLGAPSWSAPVKANKAAQAILPPALWTFEPTASIGVEWGDGSTPDLPHEWWDAMLATLKGLEGDVIVYCQGGHGRTGTFLAILAALLGHKKQGCPVLWVRKKYCQKAVETFSQIQYVEAMSGVKVLTQGSYAIQQAKREVEEKAKKAEQAALPLPAPGSGTASETGLPNSGAAYGAGDDEWVWSVDRRGLVKKSELVEGEKVLDESQDWDSRWHGM